MHDEPAAAAATRAGGVERALAAFDALVDLGETVADEWTYVNDLAAAGRAAIRKAGGAPEAASTPLARSRAAAILAAAAEIGRIEDPHRAIDWLSTFPAVVSLALGDADA
jgi:hypothetical protein